MRTILAFPADTHTGSTAGLMRDKPWQLDAGGTHHPSKAQRLLWRQWLEGWDAVRDLRQPGDRVIITMMGDAVDGKHHDTSELVTSRTEEQERMFIDLMDWTLDYIGFCDADLLQFIAGTPAHVGEMAQSERRIAEDMDAKLHQRRKFAVHGVRFDVAHQRFSVGRRAWTVENTLRSMLTSMLMDCVLQGDQPPDYVIGAHWHQFCQAQIERGRYGMSGFVCPSYQLKTSYGSQVTNNSTRPPDIGMLIVVVEDDGKSWWRCPRMVWPREKYEVI